MNSVVIKLRFYGSYDADLIALRNLNVSLSSLVKKALYIYAHNLDVKLLAPEGRYMTKESNNGVHIRVTISDEKSVQVLQLIRGKKRNMFIKTVIRDVLAKQCMAMFFENGTGVAFDETRRKKYCGAENVIPIDAFKIGKEPAKELKPEAKTKDVVADTKKTEPVVEKQSSVVEKVPVESEPKEERKPLVTFSSDVEVVRVEEPYGDMQRVEDSFMGIGDL